MKLKSPAAVRLPASCVQFRVLAMTTTTAIIPEILETARCNALFDRGAFYIGNPLVDRFVPMAHVRSARRRACEPTDLLDMVWHPQPPCILVAHDRPASLSLLSRHISREIPWIDTARLARNYWPELDTRLSVLVRQLGQEERLREIFGAAKLEPIARQVVEVAAVVGAALLRKRDPRDAVAALLEVGS